MTTLVLASKALLGVLFLTTGVAKLPSAGKFAQSVRMLLPSRMAVAWLITATTNVIIAAEVSLGIAVLFWPRILTVSIAALALSIALLIVGIFGYVQHRGAPCNCYGRLINETFSKRSIFRSVALVTIAGIALGGPSGTSVKLDGVQVALLAVALGLVSIAIGTAGRVLQNIPAKVGATTW